MVTPILHFIWGFKSDDNFGLIERLAIQSAAHHNAGWAVMLWTPVNNPPEGEQWQKLRAAVPRIQLCTAPEIVTFNGRPLPKYQHRADVLRHSLLYALGGAYLDVDTVTLEAFPREWLIDHEYTVGFEYYPDGRKIGLCNAIFLCAPQSRFGWKVLTEYQQFDPAIHGYAEFAVMRPYDWALEMPEAVNIVKWGLLGPMHWDCHAYWSRADAAKGVVVAHLWRTNHNDAMLRSLTEEGLRKASHTYAQAVKAFL